MRQTTATPLLREVRHLIGAGRDDLPDGQLLDRFARDRDEAAFEVLVRRYGRLVFGVCRQVLADRHAAEDAFQATFLVLVHKAPSLDRGRPVADWLYTVAFRLALRARANAARRREKEAEAARNRAAEPPGMTDAQAAVQEELNRLPDQHRLPLVLACLEGWTHEQVARVIGCPVGSVGWRLARAKEILRDRLASRGVVCPAAGLAALLAPAAAGAAVPAPLLEATVQAGLWFAGEPAAAAAVASAQAVELARGALGTMTTSKLTVAAGVLLAVGLCGSTAWLARSAAMADGPKPAVTKAEPRPAEKSAELPPGAKARMGTSQFRHGEAIYFVAYTADGKHLVTAGRDRAIRMWDRKSGEEVRWFEPTVDKPPEGLSVSPEPAAGKMVVRTTSADDQFPVALSADGKWLATARGRVVTVWDVAGGRSLHELTASSSVTELTFTPDGSSLVVVEGARSVSFWGPATGKAGKTVEPKPPGGDEQSVVRGGVGVSPDGRFFVQQWLETGTGNATFRVQDLTAGEDRGEIKLPAGGAQNVAFSPDGKYLAWSGFTEGIVVWDLAAHKELARFGRDEKKVRFFGQSIGFSPDGKTLAVTMGNDAIELYDVAGGKLLRTIGGHEAERSNRVVKVVLGGLGRLTRADLAFSPDGRTVAASLGNASVRQFDAGTGDEVAAGGGHATAVIAVGTDGRAVTTVSKESVRVWDASTGRELRQWGLNPPAVAAAVSPDGRLLATASGGGSVRLWDPATGKKLRDIDTRRNDVAGLGFSPDGKLFATKAELTAAVNLWDAATGDHVRTVGQDGESAFAGGKVVIDSSGIRTPAVSFSADGRLLAAAGDKKQLCVWDVATGALVRDIPAAGPQPAVAFVLSANGQALAVLSAGGAVTVYEVTTGEKRFDLKPPATPQLAAGSPGGEMAGVMSIDRFSRGNPNGGGVAFTPDGRFVLAAAGGPAIRVWDAVTGQEVTQLKGHRGSVSQLRLGPDGRHLVSGSMDTTAMVWDVGQTMRVEVARESPPSAADLDALWADLAKPDGAAAFAATRKLLTDRAAAVELVKARVRPVPGADEDRVARLVVDLGSKFAERRKAAAELEQLGELAVPQLKQALDGTPPLELRQRVEQLLAKATVPNLDGDRLRDLRAVELLELAGTPEAKRVLEALANGAAGARLTREARAAANRMASAN
jgi:RNA polymerase sigma factor (sigma-70 family)